MEIKIGCCGWNFFNPSNFFSNWKGKFKTRLQAYAKLFKLVEVNSSFYKLPKEKTAEKWFDETRINKKFEFTLKAYKGITHEDRFKTEKSINYFKETVNIAKKLKTKIILLQTPASFKASNENINNIKNFFEKVKDIIKKEKIIIAFEARGFKNDKAKEILKEFIKKYNFIHCTDPLRELPIEIKKIAYFRLHGFGKPMMYNYKFNNNELKKLKEIIKNLKSKEIYILFNNFYMYEDALKFEKIIKNE